jgi:hypothetical protein
VHSLVYRFTKGLKLENRAKKNYIYSVATVRKCTIPTERPPPGGEISAKFLRVEGIAWLAQRLPTAVNLGFSRPDENRAVYEYFSKKATDNRIEDMCSCTYGIMLSTVSRNVNNV